MTSLALLGIISSSGAVSTSRYWVGGTASWNGTATGKWAYTSGGPAIAPEPTAANDVYFDANSGGATVTVATSTRACRNLNFTGFTGAFAGSTVVQVSGSLTIGAGMTPSHTGQLTFNNTVAGNTITCNNKTLASTIIFNGLGGAWTLQDNLSTTSSINIAVGTLTTSNKTVNCSDIQTNTGGVLNLGTSSLTATGQINFGSGTITAGAATLVYGSNFLGRASLNLSSATLSGTTSNLNPFSGAGGTYGTVNLTLTAANTFAFKDANNFTSLTLASTNYATITFDSNQTVSGAFTATGGNNSTQRLFLSSSTLGTARTITCGSSSTNSNVDLQDITISGTTLTGTSIGDCGRNTSITFDAPRTCYWKHGATASVDWTTANWYTTSGGATPTNMPIPQDTARCDANSFAASGKTISNSILNARLPAWDWTGVTNSPTFSVGGVVSYRNYGSLTWSAGATYSGGLSPYFVGDRTMTITSAGKSWSNNFDIDCYGGKVTAADALTAAVINLRSGEFDDGGFSITATISFRTIGTLACTLTMGAGNTWLLSGNSGWSITTPSALTLNPSTATIKFTGTSNRPFTGGGKTYYNIWNATTSTAILTFNDGNTFNNFQSAIARTNKFTAGTTTTLTGATPMTATGTAGNVITFASSSPGTQYTISSANNITTDYITISDCIFTGGGTWHAGANAVDGGNNTGITFP